MTQTTSSGPPRESTSTLDPLPTATTAPPIVVPVCEYSDGDASKRPPSDHRLCDDTQHREKVALLFVQQHGQYQAGRKYILDRLPTGYVVSEKPRPGSTHIDRYVYGHPSGRPYPSPAQFYPHFAFLMTRTQEGTGVCRCKPCALPASRALPNLQVVLKQRLQAGEVVDEPLRQSERPLRVVDHQTLRQYLTRLPQRQHAYQPREGELVLFYRHGAGEVLWDGAARCFRFWDEADAFFDGAPEWRAGVVAQGPEDRQAFSLEDLKHLRRVSEQSTTGPKLESMPDRRSEMEDDIRQTALGQRGYKVEWYPDPTRDNKKDSWQSASVPLHHIRPFRYYGRALRGVPRDRWHATIAHAVKAMATWSLTDQYHVRGRWPVAEVACRGAWVGSELLVLGDAVHYLLRVGNSTHVKMMNLEAIVFSRTFGHDDNVRRAELRFVGKTQAGDPVIVTLDDIVGRYFGKARRIWFPNDQLGDEVADLKSARKTSAEEDTRRQNGSPWYVADNRMEQLDLDRFHSLMINRATKASRASKASR
ncbi:MAG: hypothetical protein M1823_002345 [Watsoniomyces obsoletus]|nr:MAG: hypothetical protein M1823_002345 [Watsoniomyces obsoletus]